MPCAQRHLAEVFFAGRVWPQPLAYPGNNATADQGYARCVAAFTAYDGFSPDASLFRIAYVVPDNVSWSSGDRGVLCVAYEPGVSVAHSIRGSNR